MTTIHIETHLETLRRAEQNDSTLTKLWIGDEDFSRLGGCIGENTHLEIMDITFGGAISNVLRERGFFEGVKRNTSICSLSLNRIGPSQVEAFREILKVYQENNNLTQLCIHHARMQRGDQVIVATLRRCTKLECILLTGCNITDGQLRPMVEALRGQVSLVTFSFVNNRIGNASCRSLTTLHEDPNCNLRTLDLSGNHIDNESATILANSLTNNTKLCNLFLDNNPLDTSSVREVFSHLICNTSSINDIYSSNHTLEMIRLPQSNGHLPSLLQMNEVLNKSHVAIKKILKYHPNIDMEPHFEWDLKGERNLKALPFVIAWFERAEKAVAVNGGSDGDQTSLAEKVVEERRLSTIYQFAKAMPLFFVPDSYTKVDDKKRKGEQS